MNSRDQDQYIAEQALGEIAEKTGITPHVQDVPGLQCPCAQQLKAIALVSQLLARIKLLEAKNKKLQDGIDAYCAGHYT